MQDDDVFLDTNVLIYSLSADLQKADIAERLLQGRPVISTQVLNEAANVCRRKPNLDWGRIELLLESFQEICRVVPLTLDTHRLGIVLARRHQLGIYDAMIVAAAGQAGCPVLASEDLNHGQAIDGLRIINPFI